MKKKLLFFYFLLFAVQCGAQTNVYVDSSVAASGAGTSWATAYKTLNEALNYVNGASTTIKYAINIAKGTYYPTGAQSGTNRDSTFLVSRDGIKLYGGYHSGGGTRDVTANPTVLSGNIGAATDSTDNSYHIMIAAGILTTDTLIIDGLTFAGATANGINTKTYNAIAIQPVYGGGLNINQVTAKVYVNNCIFLNNYATEGGGVYAAPEYSYADSISFTNCTFQANSAVVGAGMFNVLDYKNYLVNNCTFLSNHASSDGGGMYTTMQNIQSYYAGSMLVHGCTFSGNTAKTGDGGGMCNALSSGSSSFLSVEDCIYSVNSANNGGGIYSDGAISSMTYSTHAATIENCSFSGNTAIAEGGGIYSYVYNSLSTVGGEVSSHINSCTFANNQAGSDGGGIYMYMLCYGTYNTSSLSQCVFTGNTATTGGGGGIYVNADVNVANVLTVSRCAISENTAANGGGIYANGTPIIDSCTIYGNTAIIGGGGIANTFYGGGTVHACVVSGNTASKGGGVYDSSAAPAIKACYISGNHASNGGGVYNINSLSSFSECVISGNLADNNGGAFYNYNGSSPKISNCTLASDSAVNGAALYNASSTATASSPTVTSCIIWEGLNSIYNTNNSNPVINYTDIQSGYTGTDNSTADPVFVTPIPVSFDPDTAGDYSLLPCSPAVNTGSSTTITGSTDILGHARIYGGVIDKGAYEYEHIYPVPVTGSSSVCPNASIQLSDTLAGGIWTSSNPAIATVNNTTGMVTGVAAGTDTITYAVPSGSCVSIATKTITVNAPPALPTVSGDSTVCAAGTLTLAAAPNGGTWLSGNTTLATVSTTGKVTGITAGTDTIFYKVTNYLGCASTTAKAITVNPAPVVGAITGSNFVCQLSSIQLSDTTQGGTWTSSNPAVATIDASGMVTNVSSYTSLDTIYYTIAANSLGCTGRAAKLINADVPLVPGSVPISTCFTNAGDTFSVAGPVLSGTWASSDSAVASINGTGLITLQSAGTTDIIYTVIDTLGCGGSDSLIITFTAPYHTAETHTICPGGGFYWDGIYYNTPGVSQYDFTSVGGCDSFVTLTVIQQNINTTVSQNDNTLTSNQAGATYQWVDCTNNNAPINGQTAQSFTPTVTGYYGVMITLNGCTEQSECKAVTVVGVPMVNGNTSDVQLYPNPTTGKLTANTGNAKPAYILVKDITGRTMQQVVPTGTMTTLNLTEYVPGIYLIETIDNGEVTYTGRVSVVR